MKQAGIKPFDGTESPCLDRISLDSPFKPIIHMILAAIRTLCVNPFFEKINSNLRSDLVNAPEINDLQVVPKKQA